MEHDVIFEAAKRVRAASTDEQAGMILYTIIGEIYNAYKISSQLLGGALEILEQIKANIENERFEAEEEE